MDTVSKLLNSHLFYLGGSSVSAATLVFVIGGSLMVVIAASLIRKNLIDKFLIKYEMNDGLARKLAFIVQWLIMSLGFIQVLDWSDLQVTGAEIVTQINAILSFSIFKLGDTSISLWTAIYIGFFTVLLMIVTSRIQKWFLKRTEDNQFLDVGIAHGVSSIVRIIFLVLGFVVIVQSAGIDLSSLTIMAGAVGLGLSLGLQNLTANIVSGINLYVERPIKIGDRIEVDGVQGDVKKISLRATTIRTNDNIDIIVPNTSFLTGNVTNLSHSTKDIRVNVPFGVSYKADPKRVRQVVEEVAGSHKGVLKNPRPEVLFSGFGDSSIDFTLRVWTRSHLRTPKILMSDLYYAIFDRFREENIEIPFPQRDVYIKESKIEVTGGGKLS